MNILIYTRSEVTPFRGGIERIASVQGSIFSSDGHGVFYLHGEVCTHDLYTFLIKQQIQIVLNHEANDYARTKMLYDVVHDLSVPLVSIYHFSPSHCIDIFRVSFWDLLHSGLPWNERLKLAVRNTWLYRTVYQKYFGHCFSRVYTMSDAVVLLSEKFRPSFIKMTKIIDASRLYCIPNMSTISPERVLVHRKNKIVLFVARLSFIQKRPDLILQIWQRVAAQFLDWKLIIVGNGDYLPIMQKHVSQHHLKNIEFLGEIDAMRLYPDASILCMTSNSEGFGLVLSEASAHQVVPLCFDSFASSSDIIVQGRTGFIIKSFDIDEYAEKLTSLMRDDQLRQQMASAAQEHVTSHFSQLKITNQWYSLFSRLGVDI